MANIFRVDVDCFELKFKAETNLEESIIKWCDSFKGLKILCAESGKMQRKYGNSLKGNIEESLGDDREQEISNLVKNTSGMSLKISKNIWPDIQESEQRKKAKRFESIFSFAQMENLIFKDRKGFSRTCLVCSTDNNSRMKEKDEKISNEHAQASRLSSLSIRLIDGVVMRICDRLSNHIAQKVWEKIKIELTSGGEVCVPLIIEQNSFSFEPNLRTIKKNKDKNKDKKKDEREEGYNDKTRRIKEASQGICPYTGAEITNGGEIDHIIPQASKHGTLNDEANLIYTSILGNAKKANSQYNLSQLCKKYKYKIFPGCNSDNEIEKYIREHLLEENNSFKFDRYLGFGQMNDEEQKSFRHALFLNKDSTLRDKVIKVISNRNRTIVNGTQRYFAQCIADKIFQKAKVIGKERFINFDYFEYSSEANNDKSIYDLRKFYLENSSKDSEIVDNNKERGG